MKTLIVSRTNMRAGKCIGGLVLDNNQSVRLLTASGTNQSLKSAYQVGQVWDLTFKPAEKPIPPHTEDVLVQNGTYVSEESDVVGLLSGRLGSLGNRYWEGEPDQLFDGLVHATGNGSGYISRPQVPTVSTGFWRSDRALELRTDGNRKRYLYPTNYGGISVLTYVGDGTAIETIPAQSLVRVSLARWWTPPDVQDLEARCYLQLSGWYL